MTLTDAGPLVAIIDRDDPDHEICVDAPEDVTLPLLTTSAAFAEAMHLLGRTTGWPGQRALWRIFEQGDLEVAELDVKSWARARALTEQYSDTPIDLADATLVAVAEERKLARIFALDSNFHVYRLSGRRRALEVVPR